MIITIDGPTASGKSKTAIELAHIVGFFYINSGLLFRGLAYVLLINNRYSTDDLANISEDILKSYLDELIYTYDSQVNKAIIEIKIDGMLCDITVFLKIPRIAQAASILGTNSYARDALLTKQRDLAKNYNVVIEGRDAGSVVFPNADLKFFLTASLEIRAERWQKDQLRRGTSLSLPQARLEIEERDARDTQRSEAPLVVPAGAIIIDNSQLTLHETVALLSRYIEKVM